MKPFARALGSALALGLTGRSVLTFAAEKDVVRIANVRSGTATLLQQQRLTILEVKSGAGAVQRVALSHPTDYRQGTNAPYEAKLIAESPHHFLIFTDTFASNPGNVQGRCGASETGERFLHVVALEGIPHETLSILIDSCLLDVEPTSRSPEWVEKTDSAGFVGRVILSFERGVPRRIVYYVAPDGAVTRPVDRDSPTAKLSGDGRVAHPLRGLQRVGF